MACGPHNGAGFLFISDLTNNATGATLIILLLLYVGSQLASSLVMQSPTMDKTQRQIMLFMPLIFVFIVIKFPAGVLVYWITTNTWTIFSSSSSSDASAHPGPHPLPSQRERPAGAARRGGANVNGPTPTPKPNGADRSSLGGLGGLLRDRTKGSDASASTQTRDRSANHTTSIATQEEEAIGSSPMSSERSRDAERLAEVLECIARSGRR